MKLRGFGAALLAGADVLTAFATDATAKMTTYLSWPSSPLSRAH